MQISLEYFLPSDFQKVLLTQVFLTGINFMFLIVF